MKRYFVYFMCSESRVIYIGVTSDLQRRVSEHKEAAVKSFTERYKCKKLVYFEETGDIFVALEREKQIKRWNRSKKEFLIRKLNPSWADLSSVFH